MLSISPKHYTDILKFIVETSITTNIYMCVNGRPNSLGASPGKRYFQPRDQRYQFNRMIVVPDKMIVYVAENNQLFNQLVFLIFSFTDPETLKNQLFNEIKARIIEKYGNLTTELSWLSANIIDTLSTPRGNGGVYSIFCRTPTDGPGMIPFLFSESYNIKRSPEHKPLNFIYWKQNNGELYLTTYEINKFAN